MHSITIPSSIRNWFMFGSELFVGCMDGTISVFHVPRVSGVSCGINAQNCHLYFIFFCLKNSILFIHTIGFVPKHLADASHSIFGSVSSLISISFQFVVVSSVYLFVFLLFLQLCNRKFNYVQFANIKIEDPSLFYSRSHFLILTKRKKNNIKRKKPAFTLDATRLYLLLFIHIEYISFDCHGWMSFWLLFLFLFFV